MLTKLRIRNFKRFDDVEIELGQTVVFIGPNNSGKTTALQALALWSAVVRKDLNLDAIIEGRIKATNYTEYISRYDLTFMPLPSARLLWRNLQIDMTDVEDRISIHLEGSTEDRVWSLGFHFGYFTEDVIAYLLADYPNSRGDSPIAFLTPMSGLAATEPLLQLGRINVLIGEGRTAEVLRNLCLLLYEANGKKGHWDRLVTQIRDQFGAELLPPQYDSGRGEIRMSYKERSGTTLDLSAAGRGMLQILLLLAYMYNNPGAVLLLDEPDAHLEILRQREIYTLLNEVGQETGSQIIIATHSEVVLDQAASRNDTIIGFIGKPHPVRKISEFKKSLDLIRTEDYYLAEQAGWVLYLEGTSDLPVLQAFAAQLEHEAQSYLKLVFAKDIEGNEPSIVRVHFGGLREAYPDIEAIAVFDRISLSKLQDRPPGLQIVTWRRREIENYLFSPEVFTAFARANGDETQADVRANTMQSIIQDNIPPVALRDPDDVWWVNTKVSDEAMERILTEYAQKMGTPILRKANYFTLVPYIPKDKIDPEVTEKLNAIVAVAKRAKPRED